MKGMHIGIYLWVMDKSNQFKDIFYPIIVGVLGAMLLVAFFATLMSLGAIAKLLPFIVGFNAALTGYNLTSRTKIRLKNRRITAVGSGVMMAIIIVWLLNIICFNLTENYIIYPADMVWLIVIGAALSGLGAILAMKYQSLK
jgi:hypothetical protein